MRGISETLDQETFQEAQDICQMLHSLRFGKGTRAAYLVYSDEFRKYLLPRYPTNPKNNKSAAKIDASRNKGISRLIQGEGTMLPAAAILRLDFLVHDFRKTAMRSGDLFSPESQVRLTNLSRRIESGFGKPRDSIGEAVLSSLSDALGGSFPYRLGAEYIGFRRRSEDEEIVQYLINIVADPCSPIAECFITYFLGGKERTIKGGAIFLGECLCICGHARTQGLSGESRGLRILAVCEIGMRGSLTGHLISMDRDGPIRAHTALVRLDEIKQRLTHEQKDMLKAGATEKKLVDNILAEPRDGDDQRLKALDTNTRGFFEHGCGLAMYVSNFSLKAPKAKRSGSDPLLNIENAIRLLKHQGQIEIEPDVVGI